MKSSDLRITSDGHIMNRNEFIGFLEDDRVYVVTSTGSREVGKFDHRSEVTALVLDWFNACPQR